MVEERVPQRIESSCVCGRKAVLTIGAVEHFVGHRRILIHNVPHFYCSFCKNIAYGSDIDVTPVLKYAFRNALQEFDWNSRWDM